MALNQDCHLTAGLQNCADWCSPLLDCKIFYLEFLLWVIQINNFSNRNVLTGVEVNLAPLNSLSGSPRLSSHLGSVLCKGSRIYKLLPGRCLQGWNHDPGDWCVW